MSWWQELQSRMAEGCSLLARNHSKGIQMNEHWSGHLHCMADFLLSSLETAEPCTEFNKNFMRIITGHFLVRIEAQLWAHVLGPLGGLHLLHLHQVTSSQYLVAQGEQSSAGNLAHSACVREGKGTEGREHHFGRVFKY